MKWEPHQYQLDAVKYLISKGSAGLLLDMGLGKTSISLAAIKVLKNTGHVKHTLIVAPLMCIYTVWPEEVAKWEEFQGLSVVNLHLGFEQVHQEADIYLINPESFLLFMNTPEWRVRKFDLLVIDESTKFKSPSSQRFKTLKPLLPAFKRRWILTGSPIPNGLVDIWAQIYILDLGLALGRFITHFRNAFCVADYTGYNYTVHPMHVNTIYQRIAPLCMRLSARELLDMPELIRNRIPVLLPAKARKQYDQTELELLTLLEEEDQLLRSPNAAAAGIRCRQIANGGIYDQDGNMVLIHDAKVAALKELVESLAGNPLLILYEFRHDAHRIQQALGDIPNLTGNSDMLGIVRAFNSGKMPVVMGHPGSMGHGLNLQDSCYNVVWFGLPWDLGLYDQAISRVWRQGQKSRSVIVHHIVAENTLDDVVLKTLSQKSRTQQAMLRAIQMFRREAA